ncbi:transcriptional regulator [Clostridioides sp. ES-S-0108-01]|uniref:transcriptional regulator n=1 Tax=Clostridioides sp. ES-S-0108-01 TaxID=2770773 RepID=UPI001D0C6A18|nr:transcriptional regulator [Clostridioides sp. ES-S-0108-01]UDN52953.1 transcriptional regulator [Clostridioides sp. ES-S-0107-01]
MQKMSVMLEATAESGRLLEYVFYRNTDTEYLLDKVDDVYIGLMNEYAVLIPRFYILVNTSCNEMHILPLFFRKDSKRFYQCPTELLNQEHNSIFTRGFEIIDMVLETSQIYYYVIDTETYEPKITLLIYSANKKYYEEKPDYLKVPIDEFIREIEKESLYLLYLTRCWESLTQFGLSYYMRSEKFYYKSYCHNGDWQILG